MALPSDFSGLQGWYKADSETYADGTALGDSGAGTLIHDRSGNGRDMSQATGVSRPIFKAAVVNGLPAVRHDGSNDRLETATAMSNFVTAGAGTIYAFVRAKTIATEAALFGANVLVSDSGGFVVLGFRLNSGVPSAGSYTFDGANKETLKGAATGLWYVMCWLHSGGTLYFGLDDLTTAAMSSIGAGNTTDLTGGLWFGGRTAYFDGDWAEIALYNTAHDEATRTSLQQYFDVKYRQSALAEAARNNASRRLRLTSRPVPTVKMRRAA